MRQLEKGDRSKSKGGYSPSTCRDSNMTGVVHGCKVIGAMSLAGGDARPNKNRRAKGVLKAIGHRRDGGVLRAIVTTPILQVNGGGGGHISRVNYRER